MANPCSVWWLWLTALQQRSLPGRPGDDHPGALVLCMYIQHLQHLRKFFFFLLSWKDYCYPMWDSRIFQNFFKPPPPPLKLVLIVWSLTDLRGLDLPLEEIIPLFLTPSEFQCCVSKTNSCTNVKFPPGIKTPPGGGGRTRCLNLSGPPHSQPLSLFIVVAVSLNVFMLREPLLPEVFAKLLSENSNTDSIQ